MGGRVLAVAVTAVRLRRMAMLLIITSIYYWLLLLFRLPVRARKYYTIFSERQE